MGELKLSEVVGSRRTLSEVVGTCGKSSELVGIWDVYQCPPPCVLKTRQGTLDQTRSDSSDKFRRVPTRANDQPLQVRLASGTEIGQNMLEQILRFSGQWWAKKKLRTSGGPKSLGLLKIIWFRDVQSSNFYGISSCVAGEVQGVNTFCFENEHQSAHHFWDFHAPVRAPRLMLGEGSLKQH